MEWVSMHLYFSQRFAMFCWWNCFFLMRLSSQQSFCLYQAQSSWYALVGVFQGPPPRLIILQLVLYCIPTHPLQTPQKSHSLPCVTTTQPQFQMRSQSPLHLSVLCDLHLQSKEYLSRVCLDSGCWARPFVCFECVGESHQGHRTMSINQFAAEVDNCRYDCSLQERRVGLRGRVKGIREGLLRRLGEVRREVDAILESVAEQIKDAFEFGDSSPQPPQPLTYALANEPQKLQLRIGELQKQYLAFLEHRKNYPNEILHLESLAASEQDRLNQILSQIHSTINQLSKTLTPHHPKQQQQLKPFLGWSAQLRHSDIAVKGHSITRTLNNINDWVVALFDQRFSQKEVYEWEIKFGKKSGLVFLGVCFESKPINHKFVDNGWAGTGHDHYTISSSGKSYSHSNQLVNGEIKSFKISQNDIVRFKLDLQKYRFQATLQETKQKFEFEVVEPPEGEWYRGCVYLKNTDDSAELINKT